MTRQEQRNADVREGYAALRGSLFDPRLVKLLDTLENLHLTALEANDDYAAIGLNLRSVLERVGG